MTYDNLIQTAASIVKQDDIIKDGLTLTYRLSETKHRKIQEEIFYKVNPPTATFVYAKEFEVMIDDIVIVITRNTK